MNSTHWGIISITTIVIAGMYFEVDLVTLLPIIIPTGAYTIYSQVKRGNGSSKEGIV